MADVGDDGDRGDEGDEGAMKTDETDETDEAEGAQRTASPPNNMNHKCTNIPQTSFPTCTHTATPTATDRTHRPTFASLLYAARAVPRRPLVGSRVAKSNRCVRSFPLLAGQSGRGRAVRCGGDCGCDACIGSVYRYDNDGGCGECRTWPPAWPFMTGHDRS
jgi:hypothetical protein